MKVRRDARRPRRDVDDFRCAIHRLQRADTKQDVIRPLAEMPNQLCQGRPVTEVPPVRAEMNAANRDLTLAGVDSPPDVAEDPDQRPRTPRSAPAPNDA